MHRFDGSWFSFATFRCGPRKTNRQTSLREQCDYRERQRGTTARVASGNYPARRRRRSREGGARHQPVTPRTPRRSQTGGLNLLEERKRGIAGLKISSFFDTRVNAKSVSRPFLRRLENKLRKTFTVIRKTRAALEPRALTCVACVYYPLVCR